ncbi:hypothetical protein [Frateuria defendens]|uniref:hypothetical protein n=1 Tax=Frateuria defendens TaxID=2219559 RepID=UPI00066FDEAA|nr:hypothetical protein [Frateuria defendens]
MKTLSGKEQANLGYIATSLKLPFVLLLALTSSVYGAPVKSPDIKQNPHPKLRYEITLVIKDAPGPFDSIAGSVDYKVENDRCVPLTPISGATVAPEKSVPLVFTRISDNLYKGTLYTDLMQDEDYYGMGVCHWAMVGAGVDLKVKNVDFSPSIFLKDIFARQSVTRYFSNRSYFSADLARVDIGNVNRSDFEEEAKETFSVTLMVEEESQ